MQEVQILLEVIEDVADDFLLVIAVNIVRLATATQEDFSTIIVLIAFSLALHFRIGKRWAAVLAQAHLVDKV